MKPKILTLLRGLALGVVALFSASGGRADTIAAGRDFAGAIDGTGVLRTWGRNDLGQLGQSPGVSPVSQPQPVSGQYASVAMGQDFTIAIDTTGAVWAWGNNTVGQLGRGSTTSATTPVKVALPAGAVARAVAAGQNFGLALVDVGSDHGRIYAWGGNAFGQLGQGTINNVANSSPLLVSNGSRRYTAVTATDLAAVAIATDGSLWAWGDNQQGELAQGNAAGSAPYYSSVPVRIGASTVWTALAAGSSHVLALQGGVLYTWGSNILGQLGNGTWGNSVSIPGLVAPPAGQTWATIGAGDNHSLAVTSSGNLYGWGLNFSGELDLTVLQTGANNWYTTPQAIGLEPGLAPWTAAAGGTDFTIALTTTGGVYLVGGDANGQLGAGVVDANLNFTPVFGSAQVSGVNLLANAPVVPSTTLGVNTVIQPVTVLVQNTGSAALAGSYAVSLYLSADNVLDASDLLLATSTQSGGLGALSSRTVTFSSPDVAIPGVTPGANFLISQVVPVSAADPLSPIDGAATAVTVVGPDLTVESLAIAGGPNVLPGGTLTGVTATLRNANAGAIPAGRAVLVRAYLTNVANFSPATSVLVDHFSYTGGLGAGASVALPARTITVPAGTLGGSYQLFYSVNEDGAIAETGSTGDATAAPVNVQSYDLAVTSPSLPNVAAAADGGSKIIGVAATLDVVNASAQNLGSQAYAGGFTVSLYLSADGTLSADDRLLATITDPAGLAVGGGRLESFRNVVVPSVAPGAYSLITRIDPAPGALDSTPSDNTAALAVRVNGPDLTLTNAVLAGGPTASAGGSFTGVSYTLRNLRAGVLSAGSPLLVQVYLSANASPNPAADTLLDSYSYIGGLAAGPSSVSLPLAPRPLNVPAGTPGGSYNLFIVVNGDGAIAESGATDGDPGTGNNVLTVPVTVSAADLAVSTPTVASSTFGVNTTLGSVSTFVQNRGGQAYAAGYTLQLYLSTLSTFDGTAVLLQSSPVQAGSLGSLASALYTWSNVAIPDLAPGSYFLFSRVVLSAGQTDANQTNNVASTPVTLVAPQLTTGSFVFPNSTSVSPGGSFGNVSYQLVNSGSGAVPAARAVRIEVFLSNDTTLDRAADVLLDQYDYLGGLAAGGSVVLPSPAHALNLPQNVQNGVYQLLFVVNGNGAVAGAPVSVVAQQVAVGALDAQVSAPSISGASLGSSTSLGVNTPLPSTTVTVTNTAGFAIPPGTVVSLYLSADSTVSADDVLLATQTIAASIPGGGTRTVTFAGLTVPDAGQGSYHLLSQIVLPSGLNDLNLANNVADTPVTLNRPKLQVGAISAPSVVDLNAPSPAFNGVTFSLTNTTTGAIPAGQAVLYEVYLSTDATLSPASDTLLYSSTFTGGLAAGAVTTIGPFTTSTIPAATVGGNYYLIVVANRDSNIAEANQLPDTATQLVFLKKTNAPGLAMDYGVFTFGGSGQWHSVTDSRASGGQAFQSPVLATGQTATLTLGVTGPTTVNAPWLIIGAVADAVSYTVTPGLTAGTLTTGQTYQIVSYVAGDNFTNVGAGANAAGVNFTATGTTPATWTHGSNVQPVGTLSGFLPTYQPQVIAVPAGPQTITWTYAQNSATTTSYARLDLDLPNFSASGDGSWFGVADPTAPTGTGNSATSPVLQAGQQATLATSITVGSPGLVSFWWRTASVVNQDTLTFLIDGQPAQLPTTAAFTPAASAVISGTTAWQNVAFLVSAGTHTLSWVYAQNSPVTTSAAFVDGLEVLSPLATTNPVNRLTNPADHAAVPPSNIDLAITSVVAPTGTYLLDDAAGTGRLPLTVTVADIGADFTSSPAWDSTSLDIRLSKSGTFGDADNIILGSYAHLDTLPNGNQVVFDGEINLPFDLPADNYYLLIAFNGAAQSTQTTGPLITGQSYQIMNYVAGDNFANVGAAANATGTVFVATGTTPTVWTHASTLMLVANQTEFTLANNTFKSPTPGYTIVRAPNLVVTNFQGLSPNYPYHPEDSVYVKYTIGNTGLGSVLPTQPFQVKVDLMALGAGGTDPSLGVVVKSYAPITESVFLPEVGGQYPNGGTATVTHFMDLPSLRDLEVALGLVPAGTPEDDAKVFIAESQISNWGYYFRVFVDSGNAIAESSETNLFYFYSPFFMVPVATEQNLAQFLGDPSFAQTYVGSATLDGTVPNNATPANAAFNNLLISYATSQAPTGSPGLLDQPLSQNGVASLSVPPNLNAQYLTQTFDFNVRANDIAIDVQTSSNLVTWSTLVTLSPPYYGTSGSRSLTGFGGLADNPYVLSVDGNSTDVQKVYTARVTVRDSQPVAASPTRFMRLNVRSLLPAVVPTTPSSLGVVFDPTTSQYILSWTADKLPTLANPFGAGQISGGAFVIERGEQSDGSDFKVVGSSTNLLKDNGNGTASYWFSESLKGTATYYYRVRVITSGGSSHYSTPNFSVNVP